jgi:hypothetical protein
LNSEPRERTGLVYTAAVLGALLIVAGLVFVMLHSTQPEPLGANRVAERTKALGELRGYENDALNTTGWVDPAKGLVRLRIEDAMQIVEREWRANPSAARSNLIARVDKANPPPAPPAPSPFE